MSIELTKQTRTEAIASIERYFKENLEQYMDQRLGNIAAEALLDFFVKEIGPAVYNKAVADAQQRLQARVMELDIEIQEEEFQYWKKPSTNRK
ncbi:MAG: DUF2164 domain-containing protein [Gallionella sp.]|jgi:uncharacterized protein (DUF2164 family)|nr:DUF2164 domain-containing protein [Gallionella sp.]MCK9353002.1 DUF2164 domain-containing protein [Gallionella sp.]